MLDGMRIRRRPAACMNPGGETMDINSAISNLIAALSGSREFGELKRVKSSLSNNPQMAQQLDQFLKKQDALYSSNLSQSQAQRMMEDINREYEQLSAVPELRQYFMAADNFNTFLGQVMNAIHIGLDRQM